jgi:four helix bundle protein
MQQPTLATRQTAARTVDSLDCYRLALELARIAPLLVPRGHATLRDQLDRAATSVVLNTAEGFGRWQPREKKHFYEIALASAVESQAAIDILIARGLADRAACGEARLLAQRVVQILGGLIRSVDKRTRR